jgi:hypothetical protein
MEGKAMKAHVLSSLVALSLVTGCQTNSQNYATSKFGPPDLFRQPIERTDIIAELTGGTSTSKDSAGKPMPDVEFSAAFDTALRLYTSDDSLQRNRIQDRLIMASNEICENYKVLLKKKQAHFNFWSGAAATVLGAAGAVVTGQDAARTLSALSGASSGIRAEYNEQYFSDLAAHVITKGINARRKEILGIINEGQKRPVAEYTIETAMADAIVYHGACTLIGGLEQADATISKFVGSAGLDALGANPWFLRETEKTKAASPPANTAPAPDNN